MPVDKDYQHFIFLISLSLHGKASCDTKKILVLYFALDAVDITLSYINSTTECKAHFDCGINPESREPSPRGIGRKPLSIPITKFLGYLSVACNYTFKPTAENGVFFPFLLSKT